MTDTWPGPTAGCNIESHDKLSCTNSDLSNVLENVHKFRNYSISVIQISNCNISFLPENIFYQSSPVTEVMSNPNFLKIYLLWKCRKQNFPIFLKIYLTKLILAATDLLWSDLPVPPEPDLSVLQPDPPGPLLQPPDQPPHHHLKPHQVEVPGSLIQQNHPPGQQHLRKFNQVWEIV